LAALAGFVLSSGVRLAAQSSNGMRVIDDAIALLNVDITTTLHQGFVPYLVR
jgi:hypothetical protein